MKILVKIWQNRWIFHSLLSSIYFNFHYLPLKQGCRLPILLYKPKFYKLGGNVKILGTNVYSGMIKIGCNFVRQYPNTGFVYENFGRELIFKGKCNIGNNSAIFLSKKAKICFGENFNASTTLKIGAYKNIDFGNDVLCGWNCQFLDSDIHQLKRTNSTPDPVAIKSIHIGNNVWFAMNNIVLKGTILPDNIVVASNSLLNKNYDIPSNCLLAGIPAKVKVKNIVRIPGNDEIRIN